MDAQRALFDELMGTARNLTEEQKKEHKELKWDDPDVCGPYMVRFCPHDLFINTKSNLGPCSRIHDPKLKESFEKSPKHDSYMRRFEAELAQQCEKLVLELDRKIKRGRDRLAQDAATPLPNTIRKTEQLSALEENIKKMLVQVEELGEAGKVDEAEALMKQVDVLNAQKTALTSQIDNKMAVLEKKMELCETCGSFLFSDDALERTQSHVTGKQHIGYGMVRDFWRNTRLQRKRQGRMRGLLGRRKQMNVGIIGKKSTIMGAGVIPEEKNLGSMTVTVIVTVNEAVEERGPMITGIEDQSPEAVPTEMGRILIEVGTDIGVVV